MSKANYTDFQSMIVVLEWRRHRSSSDVFGHRVDVSSRRNRQSMSGLCDVRSVYHCRLYLHLDSCTRLPFDERKLATISLKTCAFWTLTFWTGYIQLGRQHIAEMRNSHHYLYGQHWWFVVKNFVKSLIVWLETIRINRERRKKAKKVKSLIRHLLCYSRAVGMNTCRYSAQERISIIIVSYLIEQQKLSFIIVI